jgi:hypothetical protein
VSNTRGQAPGSPHGGPAENGRYSPSRQHRLTDAGVITGVWLGGLEQSEFAGAGDRCVSVFDAEFAVEGALVGFDGVQ